MLNPNNSSNPHGMFLAAESIIPSYSSTTTYHGSVNDTHSLVVTWNTPFIATTNPAHIVSGQASNSPPTYLSAPAC